MNMSTMTITKYWVLSKLYSGGARSDETWSGTSQLQYPFTGMEQSVLNSSEANLSVLIDGVLYTLKSIVVTTIS